jgi:vacuolar-type H+-ATPase subunit I/STV1
MIIVIGEDHIDPSIQGLIKEVMFEFRRIRGDQFFLESGHEDQCEERVEQYQMQRNDCELLEKNSVAFKELEVVEGEMYRGLRDCVSYLKKYVAFAQEDLREERVDTCLDFIKKYEKKLPASKRATYVDLQTKAQKIKVRFNNLVDNSRSRRDQHMADYVRDNRSATGLNFIVVGASHVNGIANYLQDLPLMLMLPRALVKPVPAKKDEL